MKITAFVLLLSAFVLSSPARSHADEDPATPILGKVLSEVLLDLNGDGGTDRAVLIENPARDEADLYVYLSKFADASKDYTYPLALLKLGVAYNGAAWGTHPTVDVNAKGALLIKSGNDAIGRDRWSQVLTVAYRDNDIKIIGITYTSRDTLDPSAGGNCDLNLVTGRGTRNGRAVTVNRGPIRLADWNGQGTMLPKVCQF